MQAKDFFSFFAARRESRTLVALRDGLSPAAHALRRCASMVARRSMPQLLWCSLWSLAAANQEGPADWNPARGTGCARINAERLQKGTFQDYWEGGYAHISRTTHAPIHAQRARDANTQAISPFTVPFTESERAPLSLARSAVLCESTLLAIVRPMPPHPSEHHLLATALSQHGNAPYCADFTLRSLSTAVRTRRSHAHACAASASLHAPVQHSNTRHGRSSTAHVSRFSIHSARARRSGQPSPRGAHAAHVLPAAQNE